MLATIFMIGLFALAGLFLLKLVFGLGFGLLGWLFSFAIKALIFAPVSLLRANRAASAGARWANWE